MSDIATYLSCIVDQGKFAIGQVLVQQRKLKPYKFVVGDAYNFTPAENGESVTGNVVYTGTASQITSYLLSKDTFKFNLVFPETSGPFNIGNIILYVQDEKGNVFPFIWAVMKIPYAKSPQAPGSLGNRFIFEFIEKITNANDILQIQVQPSEYFSLAGYVNEFDLPAPADALFQQFVIHEPVYAPVPVIGMRRAADNAFFGFPLYSRLGDPFFGFIDGGRAGESRLASSERIIWGGKLSMTPDKLRVNYGGTKLTDKPTYTIGGSALPKASSATT